MIDHHAMRLNIVAQLPRFRGLIAEETGHITGFTGQNLVRWEPPFRHREVIARLPRHPKQWCHASRLVSRLMRLEVYRMVRTPRGTDVCTSAFGILRRQAGQDRFEVVFRDYQGRRPISLCVDHLGHVYFGEYFDNPARRNVHIFRSDDDGRTWRPCFTFGPDTIRHVHGLEFDPYRERIWVLTGDYEDEARIALASPGLRDMHIVCQGSQQTRACCGVCRPDGFIYATDTPLEQNQIYQLEPDTGKRRAVGQVQQSVFSMATACEGLFLATAIEPSPIHKTPRVHIWFSGDGQQWQEVLAIERDGWDLRLFQYPTAFIAHGPPNCPYVFLSFCGVKAYDGHCLVGRIEGNA